MLNRSTRMAAVVSTILASWMLPAWGQAYPDHPVKIVVPTSAGGGTDALARVTAQTLGQLLNQAFVVENKADAAGIVGAYAVASAAPDGYTLLFNASTHLITPYLVPSTPFDPEGDFTPITEVGKSPYVLCVTPAMGVKDLAQFVKVAKASPGAVRFGVAGVGTPDHLALELFQQAAQISTLIVPYRGGAPALQAVLSGVVDAVLLPPSFIKAHVAAGKLTALAITGTEMSDAMPGTPTIRSSGYPDYQFYSWYGLWGPKGMPPDRVQRIQNATAQMLASNEVKRRLVDLGIFPAGSSSAAFTDFIKSERARYGRLIKESNLLKR